jgi:hypothetical protein
MINKEEQKQEIYAQIVQKAWKDPEFKKNLIANPVETIEKEIGGKIEIPNGKTLVVLDEAETINNQPESNKSYLVIPERNHENIELTEEELEAVAGGFTIKVGWSEKDGWSWEISLSLL